MKEWQMHLEKIRIDAAECRFLSTQAAIGKRELLTRLAENLNALALDVEEAMATNGQQATRSRRMRSWLLVVVLAAIAGAAFFWVNNRAEKNASSVATMQSKPEPSPAPQDYRDQAMAVLLSSSQGERKVLTEQLGALAARVDILERALANLERARAEIAGPSNKQSVGSEENHTAAETKPSAPEEKPVRTEEKRISTLEKPAAAEENADAKQSDGVPSGTGNPFIEPVDQVGATPVPKQAELNPRKPAIGPPGCTHFRSFDPVSGIYTSFDGRRHQCR
jgi:BA14K-like protein